jgi:hypothetical protein
LRPDRNHTLGDQIAHVRFCQHVQRRGGRVVLACDDRLIPLFSGCPGVDQIVADGISDAYPEHVIGDNHDGPMPPTDSYDSICSVPARLGEPFEELWLGPYLSADPVRVERWRRELDSVRGFRVGIVWQGNPRHAVDRLRSFPLNCYRWLARIPGVSLISLQVHHGLDQLRDIRFPVVHLGDRLAADTANPFLDTVAAMKCLDLVIAPSTAAIHLAGALGIPAWLIMPSCWFRDYYAGSDPTRTPWYPSVRLFRQDHAGDWDDVFRRMADVLADQILSLEQH